VKVVHSIANQATIDNCLNDIATTDACEGRMLVNEVSNMVIV
jgi:hypothetical protein